MINQLAESESMLPNLSMESQKNLDDCKATKTEKLIKHMEELAKKPVDVSHLA